MGRTRSPTKIGFPDRMYERNGYFSWRHPVTREEWGLGRDRESAIVQAREANARIEEKHPRLRLVNKIDDGLNPNEMPVGHYSQEFASIESPFSHLRLFPLDRLRRYHDQSLPCDEVGIYFLWADEDLLYIGQSRKIESRVANHRAVKRIPFTKFSFIRCGNDERLLLERMYIYLYKPRYNKA